MWKEKAEQHAQANRGDCPDGRPDCGRGWWRWDPAGRLPAPYEGMDGHTSDKATLRGFLAPIEGL